MAATATSLEDLLAPISAEHPAGEDITLAPDWQEINLARRKDKLLGRQNADWPLIQQLTSNALAHKAKDLRLAVWLTEANLNLSGFAGLRDSLQLIRGLVVNFWDSGLYPELEDGDLQFRAMPLDWFSGDDNLPYEVRRVPLTARSDGGRDYSYSDYRQSRKIGWEKDVRNSLGDIDPGKEEKRKAELAAGGVSAEMFDEAVRATRRARVETLHSYFKEAWDELQSLDKVLNEKFAPDVPGTGDARDALEDCRRVLDELLARKRQEEPDPRPPGEPAGPADQNAARSSSVSLAPQYYSDTDGGGSWAQAEELIRQGNVNQGLQDMTRLASQHYGRAAFQHRLRLAEICLSIERKRLAIAILEDLAKTVEELHLEKWEAPELLGRVWGQLHRCYKGAEPGSEQAIRAASFMDRLCKLDPWQALRWDE